VVLPGAEPTRRWPRPVGLALWLGFVVLIWHDVLSRDTAATFGDDVPAGAIRAIVLATLAGRLVAQAVEAGFYAATWRMFAKPIRFGEIYVAVVSLSLLDALASTLIRAPFAAGAPWLALLAGPRALADPGAGTEGLGLALGSFGLLALARVAGTAWAQRRGGAPWRGALGLTFAVWLAGRLATWWTADLLRGMSTLP
jgi:hypothetical protein